MSSIYLNLTNKEAVQEIIAFSTSLLSKREGIAQMKIIRFLAYLNNVSGKSEEAAQYLERAISFFETNGNVGEIVECYSIGGSVWHNNLAKQKEIINKMYLVCKVEARYLGKLEEMVGRLLAKLAARGNVELERQEGGEAKGELFKRIVERVGGNFVDYVYTLFGQMSQGKQSKEIAELLQFASN